MQQILVMVIPLFDEWWSKIQRGMWAGGYFTKSIIILNLSPLQQQEHGDFGDLQVVDQISQEWIISNKFCFWWWICSTNILC